MPVDLLQFHPVAADLDLVVAAAQEGQAPVRVPPHPVSGAVHPGAHRAARFGQEAVRRRGGASHVAPGHPGPTHVKLSRRAVRDGPQ